jgi:hypothetical protein
MHAHGRTPTACHTHAHARRRCLGARDLSVEVPATSVSTLDHVNHQCYNLVAKIRGGQMCYVDAMVHDVEIGIHFLKIFPKGVYL